MTEQTNNQILTRAHHEFSPELLRHAHLKIRDFATGEDLVQTTFIKTWRYLQAAGKIDLMRAFLYHILNRLIIDEYRKKKTISLDLLAEGGFELAAPNHGTIFDAIDGKALTLLIQKLPEKYRSAVTMRYTDDLSLKEMSVEAHQSQNTMSVRVHRGLAMLKLLYAGSAA